MNSVHALFRRVGNPTLLLIFVDLLVALAAFGLAVMIRFGFQLEVAARNMPGPMGPRVLLFVGMVLLGLLSVGLYRGRQRPTHLETTVRVGLAMAFAAFGCIVAFFILPPIAIGRGVLAIALLLTGIGVVLCRRVLLPAVDGRRAKRRVLVLGTGRAAAKIGMLRRRADRRRFEVVGYVPADEDERKSAVTLGIGPLHELDPARIRALRVDEVVVALDDQRGMFPVESLLQIKLAGIPVTPVVSFLERETERIDLDVLHPAWLLYEHSRHTEIIYRWAKRWFDVAFALLILVIMSPVLLFAVLAIAWEAGGRGPVFYRQKRVGLHGDTFNLLKFRSMRVDAEQGGARWARDNDDRVTPVGRWLRRFRIDELPQLLNILRGDMSVVGPRPERPEFVAQILAEVPLYYYRHCVRPGLAGWAQLNFPYGASVEDAREKLKYDLYYIKNAGIITDMLILFQTAEVVFFGRGTAMSGRRRRVDGQPGPGSSEASSDDGKPAEDARQDAA